MKIAIEFTFEILSDRKAEYQKDGRILSDEFFLEDAMDFEYDIYDSFIENWEELKEAKTGFYHVFQYGDVSGETSYTEYGPEFDGWIFEPEYTDVKRIEVVIK